MPVLNSTTDSSGLTCPDARSLRSAATLESAARALTQTLHADFGDNVVLARLFLTQPFGRLPDDLRRSAWNVVEAQGLQGDIRETTPVLTLLGTSGRLAEWCDRRRSRTHAAIPLCSRVFVDSIPMLARMLQEMGIRNALRQKGPGQGRQ